MVRRNQRSTLSRRTVVARTLALADAEGLEAVTIRRLATELGVTPMALYWHYRSKDELLDGMAASIFEGFDASLDDRATWQQQLRALLASVLDALRAHPSTAALVSTRTIWTDEGLRMTETMLHVLRRAGFSPAEATQIARHAVSTVANLVAGEPGVVIRDDSGNLTDARRRAQHFLQSLSPEQYPRLVEAAVPLTEGIDPDVYFAFGLDLLLAGIETVAASKRRDVR